MKKLLVLLGIILLSGCDILGCDCDYVVYDNYNGEGWKETYRSTWDDCAEGVINESIYYFDDGTWIKSETIIECD